MSESPAVHSYAKFSIALAALLALPATWSFFSAIYFAATTGEVLVISLGRYETAREMVAWPKGWARFVGPVVLVAAIGVWVASDKNSRMWWFSAALSALSLALLLFSRWFTSWDGAFWFIGVVVFISISLFIGNRYGRLAAYVFVVLVLALIFWRALGGA
jgi:hypothetical protein